MMLIAPITINPENQSLPWDPDLGRQEWTHVGILARAGFSFRAELIVIGAINIIHP